MADSLHDYPKRQKALGLFAQGALLQFFVSARNHSAAQRSGEVTSHLFKKHWESNIHMDSVTTWIQRHQFIDGTLAWLQLTSVEGRPPATSANATTSPRGPYCLPSSGVWHPAAAAAHWKPKRQGATQFLDPFNLSTAISSPSTSGTGCFSSAPLRCDN